LDEDCARFGARQTSLLRGFRSCALGGLFSYQFSAGHLAACTQEA
jgi:hypothetical protein